VEHFVPAADIDPVFYERSYFLGAREGGEEAYALLHEALSRSDRAAIGRFTFHNREHVAAIRALDGVLALHTLRLGDEVVFGEDVSYEPPQRAPRDREVAMAAQLVETLHEDFEPERYHDEYRDAVLDLIERKAAGEPIGPREDEQPDEAADLVAALEASLAANARTGR
jgi:DNA end-binding protein Ku